MAEADWQGLLAAFGGADQADRVAMAGHVVATLKSERAADGTGFKEVCRKAGVLRSDNAMAASLRAAFGYGKE